MNLSEKIGQMLVYGWMGESTEDLCTLGGPARLLVSEFKVGGVILMGRNAQSPQQLRELTGALQSRARDNGLPPLLICIDQEGGPVSRLVPPNFRASRAMWEIGETGDPREARREAASIGRELLSVGINWDLAPVLDVNNNPANPVIGRRSFGANPALVAAMAVSAVRGFQDDAGVMACGKHFPGHGDTAVDSHAALPVIPHPLERLEEIELAPFRAAIEAGIAAIMTAHILFPAIDPEMPATLSRPILTDLLRRQLGFHGIIVTDCLEMRGVAAKWSAEEAALLAVEAGADILLCCHTLQTQKAIRESLLRAAQSGRIPEKRIDESVERILAAKNRWAAHPAVREAAVV